MDSEVNSINQKITSFKRKHYLNLFIRGTLLTVLIVVSYFLLAVLMEHNLWLSKSARFFLFSVFFLLVAISVFIFLKAPLSFWVNKRGLSEQESAKLIGAHFPSVADRLLNLIQLTSNNNKTDLIEAGIKQKSLQLKDVDFELAVNLRLNNRYWKLLMLPASVIIILIFVDSTIFTQSTKRIVQFNQEFSPEAPFKFIVKNEDLNAFFNEDFIFKLDLEGNAIPQSAYIILNGQRWKMDGTSPGSFEYVYEKIQDPITFQVEASGFISPLYKINLIQRPEINQLQITLIYPSYTGRSSEKKLNAGYTEVPEGTLINWNIKTHNSSDAEISFEPTGEHDKMQLSDDQNFTFKKRILESTTYSIQLHNQESINKDKISYSIDVIKDQHPQIIIDNLKDSVLYRFIAIAGSVKDDYGISGLELLYTISNAGQEDHPRKLTIPISKNSQSNFFYQWNFDSLKLSPGDKISYYLQVWDNDAVNGRKSTRSSSYVFAMPTKEEMATEISKNQETAENKIDQSLMRARELQKNIENAEEKLRGKQSMDWQDKKMLEDLVKQRQKLDQMIQDLQKQNSLLEQKKESFTKEDDRIKEKSEQIQKLMNELLDDESKKLFEELEKLLKENSDPQQAQKLLEKIDKKEINLEKELDRALQLFKQLQFDYKLDQAIKDIKSQKERQSDLINKTEEAIKSQNDQNKQISDSSSQKPDLSEKLGKEQEEISKELEKFEKSIEDIKKLGEEINESKDLPSKEQIDELKKEQKDSQESFKSGNPQKSLPSQKKSKEDLEKMEKQMESTQNGMEMELDMQNLESLKHILHGLLKLSFDQEDLMKEFGALQPSDPKNIQVSQDQLKLKDNSKVLEDSILALAKKDPFLGSIVTREVSELNDHVDKAVYNLKERRKGNASAEMQFSMTKINNLALMLNDHFEMMMKMMQNARPGKGKSKKGSSSQNLGMMQEKINQEIEKLKNGQKTGKQLSQDLARLAAEQERIRKALQEMQEKMKKEGGKMPGGDLPSKMEQTEMDLVNKQITEQTIRRQKEILTRLLETEKSMREQNLDKERKGEAAKEHSKEIPKVFEEYLKLKEKEVELLKTYPPKFSPYYRKEVTEYFKRIN
jgi:hypothetical protein